MNRFRPMAATQAGGAGGKEKAGQRACERQLLRVRGPERDGPAMDRQVDPDKQREEVPRFQGMTPVFRPHKHTNIRDLSKWQTAFAGRSLNSSQWQSAEGRGRGSCCCVPTEKGLGGTKNLSRCPRLHHLLGFSLVHLGPQGHIESYPRPLTSRFSFLGKCSFQPH